MANKQLRKMIICEIFGFLTIALFMFLPWSVMCLNSSAFWFSSSSQNGLHYQHRARSYSCVSFRWLNGVTQYWSRNLCGFAYHRNTSDAEDEEVSISMTALI
ncbi:hypothetical protein T12_15545 [Trichinella patagoniensis]|uniref:Uncharacterized protein n=1 Tax=Trichinella patagoniensis TaxID=990121 RepID=A0A0V0ZN16_9BILA|nr:hypothetical protein T12_15545 [Trichinella patagoniensis]